MKLPGNRFSFVKNSAVLVATIIVFFSLVIAIAPAVLAAPQSSVRALEPADMQNLIFVWASGTASIQQQALHICQIENISPGNCGTFHLVIVQTSVQRYVVPGSI